MGHFSRGLLQKYFPTTVWHQKEIEFLELIQENLSVAAYEAKFIKLARFSADVVASKSARARKFQRGLRPGIRSKLAPFLLSQYSDMVHCALVVEQEYDDFSKIQEQKGPRLPEIPKLRVTGQNSEPPKPVVSSLPSRGAPLCRAYGKYHFGKKCPGKPRLCFSCGSPDHVKKDCPREASGAVQRPFIPGRAYAMTHQDP